jgi:DNA-binding transcriptional LysR family regulator
MRLRHIEVFNAVMLTGSVSAAARLINITQPAVSRTLAHAELQLGFALFERNAGRLKATAEAQALFPYIQKLFAQLDEVQMLSRNLKQGKQAGVLRVLTIPAFSYELLPRALIRFRQRYPEVRVEHEALHSNQVVAGLALREADIGFLFDTLAHPALQKTRLGSQAMTCVAPKGMLPKRLVKLEEITLTDLHGLPLIELNDKAPVGSLMQQKMSDAKLLDSVLLSVQTYHVAIAMAQHGLGIALVDSCTASSADTRKVDVLQLLPRINIDVHALRAVEQTQSVMSRFFVKCMQQSLNDSEG